MTWTDDSLYMTKKEIRSFFEKKGLSEKLLDKEDISNLSHKIIRYFPKIVDYENLENSVYSNLNSVVFFLSKSPGESTCLTPEFTSSKIAADYVWASIANEYFDTNYIR